MFKIKVIGLFMACFLVSACDELSWPELTIYEQLQGTWQSACTTDDSDLDDIEYLKETATFDDGVVTVSMTYYETDSCVDETSTDTITGVYLIGDTLTTANGHEANYIDFLFYDIYEELNIFLIESDQLYMGIATDDDTRPTEIDGTYWLEKQE